MSSSFLDIDNASPQKTINNSKQINILLITTLAANPEFNQNTKNGSMKKLGGVTHIVSVQFRVKEKPNFQPNFTDKTTSVADG